MSMLVGNLSCSMTGSVLVSYSMYNEHQKSCYSSRARLHTEEGNLWPVQPVRIAQNKFRSLPYSTLAQSDFDFNSDSALDTKTTAACFGSVSAFISHSWRDPAPGKWKVLSEWARQHKEADPTLWLDKACIEQVRVHWACVH